MSFQFQVNLILATTPQTKAQTEELEANCTFVKNNLWIFEGDTTALNARFELLDIGVAGGLGGLSTEELVKICKESFCFDWSLLD